MLALRFVSTSCGQRNMNYTAAMALTFSPTYLDGWLQGQSTPFRETMSRSSPTWQPAHPGLLDALESILGSSLSRQGGLQRRRGQTVGLQHWYDTQVERFMSLRKNNVAQI
jgi:hypothetical protein